MEDVLIRLEALRLAHNAAQVGVIKPGELIKCAQSNYEFLRATKKTVRRK